MGKAARSRVSSPGFPHGEYRKPGLTGSLYRKVSPHKIEDACSPDSGYGSSSSTGSPYSAQRYWSSSTSNSSPNDTSPLTTYGTPSSTQTCDQSQATQLLRVRALLGLPSTESQLEYYTRTASYKYNRTITHHTGIIRSSFLVGRTCAAMHRGQKTCTHVSTRAGDVVNYIPVNDADGTSSDVLGLKKLTVHFLVLLPSQYKPTAFRTNSAYHAALVISKNPVGTCSPLLPQPDANFLFEAENISTLHTVVYDAYSERRPLVRDGDNCQHWQWKENTSVSLSHVKIVHQDDLHAVIVPNQPAYGLRLSDESFQQVLRDLGEEDEVLKEARLAYLASGASKGRRCAM
ncbi:MAG: hypothetical protein Q9183_007186, partial [Haloplaca sp. 2 TL-2023]